MASQRRSIGKAGTNHKVNPHLNRPIHYGILGDGVQLFRHTEYFGEFGLENAVGYRSQLLAIFCRRITSKTQHNTRSTEPIESLEALSQLLAQLCTRLVGVC